MKTEAVMCMAFTRHNPSWTALFRTNCSIVLVMFTNPRRLGTSNQRCSVNVFIQSFNRRSRRGWLFAAARFARVGLEVVPGLIFVNESLDRHRPVMMGLGFGTSSGKPALHQAPGFLPLLHRMEERAGERRCVFIGFPSPRSSPHSFLAGRGWRAWCSPVPNRGA